MRAFCLKIEHTTIQIFVVGIGEDSDVEVGRILAEATGAQFQDISEEDLANLIEELTGYF